MTIDELDPISLLEFKTITLMASSTILSGTSHVNTKDVTDMAEGLIDWLIKDIDEL